MLELAGPLARVLLRYFGGSLMTYAGIKIDITDPDIATLVVFLVGALFSAVSEGWWYLARKYGWCQ